jgi:hypothetical protein
MSSKGTRFLTKDNEHCYDETFEKDGNEFRIYLEIDKKNITYLDYSTESGILIGIKGDSELAKVLRSVQYKGE